MNGHGVGREDAKGAPPPWTPRWGMIPQTPAYWGNIGCHYAKLFPSRPQATKRGSRGIIPLAGVWGQSPQRSFLHPPSALFRSTTIFGPRRAYTP